MIKKRKKLTWMVPIGIAVILFLALWANQISNERQLPSPGWSRTVHPQVTSTYERPYAFKNAKGIQLFTLNNGGITHSTLNEKLHVIHKSLVKTQSNVERVIWANNSVIVYKMDLNLYLDANGKTKMIAKSIGDAKVGNDNMLYYAQGKTLHSYNIETGAQNLLSTFHDPIEVLSPYNGGVIIATQDEESNFHFYNLADADRSVNEFARFNGMSHGNISVLETVKHDGKLGMFFTAHVLSQGEHFYDFYKEFSPDKLAAAKPVTINETALTFTVKDTGEYVNTPADMHLYLVDGKPTVLFRSEGSRTMRESSINVYEGYQNNRGQWIAERRSTSPEMSQLPFRVDKNTIGWLDFVSTQKGTVGFTTKNPSVIDQSMQFSKQDFSHSFSNATLSLSRVFMLFLLMIGFSIPAILIYAVISFTKVELIENDSQVAKWIILAVFYISEFLLVGKTQTPAFKLYAPGYLNFDLSRWIIPAVMVVLTVLLVKWIKTKDWGIATEVFYSMILMTVMVLFTFGPYFF